ncbi:hypothetical protein [Actinomadura sp. 21ATH]|uniref:hypothetical protein n=1 Tax=Actinomadura sp. 21ATH TaxID=1735444 RepID=UPI0035C07F36
MSGSYRPGQLYKGREGDLLYVVLPGAEIEFVTNRGTRVPREKAERVYGPLTLVRPVGTEAPAPLPDDVRALAEAIREALDMPIPDRYSADRLTWLHQQRDRVISVMTQLELLRTGASDLAQAAKLIRDLPVDNPLAYTPDERGGYDRLAGVVAKAVDEIDGDIGGPDLPTTVSPAPDSKAPVKCRCGEPDRTEDEMYACQSEDCVAHDYLAAGGALGAAWRSAGGPSQGPSVSHPADVDQPDGGSR